MHAFFTGSLLIETIFSLDGLGLLGFESVLNRDYPVVFATLYIFSLVGLVVNLISRSDLYAGSIRASTSRRARCEVDARNADRTPDTTAIAPTGLAVLPERRPLKLSPINRRRWENFKANRRGYWSFWIFLGLFLISLGAEFIANDRPLLVNYDGRWYFPIFVNYPETTFGGDFETSADYRDPFVQTKIADSGGYLIWPPIRYSYNTHNLDLPTPAPSPPTWMLTEVQCRPVLDKKRLDRCSDLEYNWLGTDDQGRDVVARTDLRLPHLGVVRPGAHDRLLRHRGGGGRSSGLFRRLDRPACFSASSKSGPRCLRSISS